MDESMVGFSDSWRMSWESALIVAFAVVVSLWIAAYISLGVTKWILRGRPQVTT
jgi:hypothetical protein